MELKNGGKKQDLQIWFKNILGLMQIDQRDAKTI